MLQRKRCVPFRRAASGGGDIKMRPDTSRGAGIAAANRRRRAGLPGEPVAGEDCLTAESGPEGRRRGIHFDIDCPKALARVFPKAPEQNEREPTLEHSTRQDVQRKGQSMSIHSNNNYPRLHNAMWPGLVGKGSPGAEPFIDLDTMLNLTAGCEVC